MRPRSANIDIIATTLSAAQAGTGGGATVFDDGVWHHVAWTWTKAPGEMRFYTDGVLRFTQTSTQTNHDLLISDSLVGALGAKRDNNRYFARLHGRSVGALRGSDRGPNPIVDE